MLLKQSLKKVENRNILWTDKGKEYYNKHVKELLDKNKITLYSTENEEKSSPFVKDGTVQLKPRCGSSLLFKVIHSI